MAEHGAALAREAGFEVEGWPSRRSSRSRIAETIVRVALERDTQAIVVGIQGRGGLGEVILGSTSRDVIRCAPCPVVVARMPPRDKR